MRRQRAHYDVTVITVDNFETILSKNVCIAIHLSWSFKQTAEYVILVYVMVWHLIDPGPCAYNDDKINDVLKRG